MYIYIYVNLYIYIIDYIRLNFIAVPWLLHETAFVVTMLFSVIRSAEAAALDPG